jgi:2-dehydro-3-deoxy-D-arabinonate dehydratase
MTYKLWKFDKGWFLENEGMTYRVDNYHVNGLFSGSVSIAEFVGLAAEVSLLPLSLPLAPVIAQEIWASGVTYRRSASAWMSETGSQGSVYDQVYRSDRPQTFYKGASHDVTGPGTYIGIRADSLETHPEAELAVVCDPVGKLIGYTLGNDVSARDIERKNPLFQPQSKVFDGCVSLGPAIVLATSDVDPLAWRISLSISRLNKELFSDNFFVNQLNRKLDDIIKAHVAFRKIPYGIIILTGTALVVPDFAMLRDGDKVAVNCSEIGLLESVARSLR